MNKYQCACGNIPEVQFFRLHTLSLLLITLLAHIRGLPHFSWSFTDFERHQWNPVFSRTHSTSRSPFSDVRSVCVRLIKHLRNMLSFLSADGQCYTKYMKGGRKRKLTRRREERGETAGKRSICAHVCVCVWWDDRVTETTDPQR